MGPTKLNAYANRLSVARVISVSSQIENIVRENAGYQYFIHSPQCLKKASFSGSLNGIL